MLRRTLLLVAGFATPVAVTGRASAQRSLVPDPTPRVPPQPGQGLPAEDGRSLQRAARLSDAQVEAGTLAAGKASSMDVKRLAAGVAEDHARYRRTVGELAAARRVELPDRKAAGIEDPSLVALREATGDAVDRAFLSRQLGLYRPMAELYQTMASNSPDPALARFGITALAAIRVQQDTARALGARYGLRADTIESPPQY